MRRFNPDKELYKIQHGNKNKVLYGIILLLLIISIGSTYALYQVRYSKRIIYTKVAPFSTHDLDLAIYVDGKPDKLPEKGEGYYFDKVECEMDDSAIATWDYKNWKLNTLSATIPNKCDIYFVKNPTLNSHLAALETTELVDDNTNDHNLRYIGPNPSNYIWFNCRDYDGLTQETAATQCERWRIIGIINKMTVEDETSQETSTHNLVKIMNPVSLGDIRWNTSDWTKTPVKNALDNYLNQTGSYTSTSTIKGIFPNSREKIANVKWYFISYDNANSQYVTPFYLYNNEYKGGLSDKNWIGKIALPNASDFGFSTNGGGDRESCINSTMYIWPTTSCALNSWIAYLNPTATSPGSAGNDLMLLSEFSTLDSVFVIRSGNRGLSGQGFSNSPVTNPRPTLYLKDTIYYVSGDGSYNTPFIIN